MLEDRDALRREDPAAERVRELRVTLADERVLPVALDDNALAQKHRLCLKSDALHWPLALATVEQFARLPLGVG
jgi:hypothetical protein